MRRGAITGGIVGILAVISFAVLWELCPFDVEQLERLDVEQLERIVIQQFEYNNILQ